MAYSTLQSWRFWVEHKDYLLGKTGFSLPGTFAKWKELWPEICPLYKGIASFWFENEQYDCVCSLLSGIASINNTELESEWSSRTLRDLTPFHTNNEDMNGEIDLKKLLVYLDTWVINFPKWLFIQGKPGTGKSTILWALRSIIGQMALYISAEDFQQLSFQALADRTTDEFIGKFVNIPILLFDDFGLEHKTEFTTNQLSAIINQRYAQWKDRITVMTSNLELGRLTVSPDIAVQRIASRMSDRQIVTFAILRQGDYRVIGGKHV